MNTLVYHTGGLGDFITILPVLRWWRGSDPAGTLSLLGTRRHAELAKAYGLIDEHWDVESAATASLFTSSPARAIVDRLRRFEAGLVFESPAASIAATLSGLGVRRIMRQPAFPAERIPIIDYHLSIIGPAHSAGPAYPVLDTVDPALDAQARQLLPYAKPCVAIHPGSGSARKNWPLDRFIALSVLLEKLGRQCVWIRGPAEEAWPIPATGRVAQDLPLPVLAHLLRRCELFIGNDSGIAHLSAAAGCAGVIVFGPSDPSIWAPAGENVTIISHHAHCGPCHRIAGQPLSCDAECLTSISIEEVFAACRRHIHPHCV
jgi:heptosyltransferase-3